MSKNQQTKARFNNKVRLTEKQFKKALRQLIKLLMKAISTQSPIKLTELATSVSTVRGRNLSTASDGMRCLHRILVEREGVLVGLGRGRYGWQNKKKLGRTIKESVNTLYDWVRNYQTTPIGHPTEIKEGNAIIEDMAIIQSNYVLIMPKERAVLRQLLRSQAANQPDAITQLAIDRLIDVLDENRINKKQQKLLPNVQS